jgi:hypothetical protein
LGPTVVSSKVSVKLPDSPQCVGSAAGGPLLPVGIAAARLTTVLKLLGVVNSSNEGSSDRGVWRIDLVVRGIVRRSEGSGPVTVR